MSSTKTENALGSSASAYLRSAARQPVQWMEWGEAAFQLAVEQNKPILLDVGAVWCHWCHVMDRESYESPQTAALINEHFVAIKVDRDERPDVDARYQAAVAAISGQGGWPLTAFLTPAGHPYFGGGYFPSEERYGRPNFARVLSAMANAWQNRRDDVLESAASVMLAIESNETFDGRAAVPRSDLLCRILDSILVKFDQRHGGFGSQPKFPHPGALDLLLDAASRMHVGELAHRAAGAARLTLEKMAAGGVYDHLGGGFHRYSTDERWRVPHFEKLAYDNGELLRVYAHAFQTFADPQYARVATDIVRWMDACLSDREQGGFFSSQDADDSLEDDGDYFTWARGEVRSVLSEEEFAVAELLFDLRTVGDMHHNPAKNVLHRARTVQEIASRLKLGVKDVETSIRSMSRRLHAARMGRRAPFIDRTVYTGWNGLCIAGYLAAGRALGLPDVTAFGLRSLDRVLATAWQAPTSLAPGLLLRVVAYADGHAGTPLPGMLDDYALIGNASLDAWEATGSRSYFEAAVAIAEAILARFADVEAGFFDIEIGEGALGALTSRRKPIQDAPTPAGNFTAATLLLRLATVTQRQEFHSKAEQTLMAYAGVVEHFGVYAGSFGLAWRRLIEPAIQVAVVGSGDSAEALVKASLARFSVETTLLQLHRDQIDDLPVGLAGTMAHVSGVKDETAVAILCRGSSCLPPITDPEELLRALRKA